MNSNSSPDVHHIPIENGSQINFIPTIRPWTKNANAREHFFAIFSSFYALFLIIVALVVELSRTLRYKQPLQDRFEVIDLIFAIYMFGGAFVFFLYYYSIILHSRWSRPLLAIFTSNVDTYQTTSETSNESLHSRVSHSSPTTGSLYLRLGCIAFGTFGVVSCGLHIILCFTGWGKEDGTQNCDTYGIAILALAMCFIFVQMHFVFCNSQITIHGFRNTARLGLMHLVAANIWVWIRYIVIEECETTEEIGHVPWNKTHFSQLMADSEEHEKNSTGVKFVLGEFADMMYTCVIEYSMICAGVMFVVWKKVGCHNNESHHRRSHKMSADCSKTTSGLFCGLAFLAVTFISMALFHAYVLIESDLWASVDFFVSVAFLLLLASLACIYAFWRMKDLNFVQNDAHSLKSAQLLDRLLLVAGFIGELIFSIAGLFGLIGDGTWTTLSWILLTVHIVRLTQVCLQTGLLLMAEQLKIQDSMLQDRKPGKQVITFLLVANVALFIMNTFEAQKAGISPEIVHFYGLQSWAMLVRGCAPLCIFYRFHSSVCFAEVWKHTYPVNTEQNDSSA